MAWLRQQDDHVRRWRRLLTEALQAIRHTIVQSRQRRNAIAWQRDHYPPIQQMWRMLKTARGFAQKLPLLGPHQTWPRWQKQGPSNNLFHRHRVYTAQREAAIEWCCRVYRMTREEAARQYDNNDRGIVR